MRLIASFFETIQKVFGTSSEHKNKLPAIQDVEKLYSEFFFRQRSFFITSTAYEIFGFLKGEKYGLEKMKLLPELLYRDAMTEKNVPVRNSILEKRQSFIKICEKELSITPQTALRIT